MMTPEQIDEILNNERRRKVRDGEVRPALITPVTANPKDQKILDRAASGDTSVLPEVKELLKDPNWVRQMGSLEIAARAMLIGEAAGDNLMVAEAVRMRVKELRTELQTEDGLEPCYLVRLTVTRVIHCWLGVHILEAMATKKQAGSSAALAIERQLASAERRLHSATRALATIRRLARPPNARLTVTGSAALTVRDAVSG